MSSVTVATRKHIIVLNDTSEHEVEEQTPMRPVKKRVQGTITSFLWSKWYCAEVSKQDRGS